jgi:hypothetical protein
VGASSSRRRMGSMGSMGRERRNRSSAAPTFRARGQCVGEDAPVVCGSMLNPSLE